MGKVWNLEFAVGAACSLLVRHHGSHACLQCTVSLLTIGLAKSSHRFCGSIAYWSSPLSHHIHLLLYFVCSLPFRGSPVAVSLCSLWSSEGTRVAGRLLSGVCCYSGSAVGWPRSVSLLSRFCGPSWRKEVVASYLALSVVLLGRVCVYCISTVVYYASYCVQLPKHASWWMGSCVSASLVFLSSMWDYWWDLSLSFKCVMGY